MKRSSLHFILSIEICFFYTIFDIFLVQTRGQHSIYFTVSHIVHPLAFRPAAQLKSEGRNNIYRRMVERVKT